MCFAYCENVLAQLCTVCVIRGCNCVIIRTFFIDLMRNNQISFGHCSQGEFVCSQKVISVIFVCFQKVQIAIFSSTYFKKKKSGGI